MRHSGLTSTIVVATVLALVGALAPRTASAQAPEPAPPAAQEPAPVPPGPYKPVAITPPPVVSDPTFEPFRKQLREIAQKKDRAALGKMVANDFFWIPEDTDVADKSKPGIENLARALGLDEPNTRGWDALANFAAERTGSKDEQRQGVICAPGDPGFDGAVADQLANETQTDASDWAYPVRDGIEVRDSTNATAPVIEKLGLHLVRLLPDASPANVVKATHLKVMTPTGKIGFVPNDLVLQLINPQICYLKDASGWKIAGYNGEEHSQ
jgi:hypothetical protein